MLDGLEDQQEPGNKVDRFNPLKMNKLQWLNSVLFGIDIFDILEFQTIDIFQIDVQFSAVCSS